MQLAGARDAGDAGTDDDDGWRPGGWDLRCGREDCMSLSLAGPAALGGDDGCHRRAGAAAEVRRAEEAVGHEVEVLDPRGGAGGRERLGVLDPGVVQRVEPGDDDQRRRQAGQVGGVPGRHPPVGAVDRLAAVATVAGVLAEVVAQEDVHVGVAQDDAARVGDVRRALAQGVGQVGRGVEQRLVRDRRARLVARHSVTTAARLPPALSPITPRRSGSPPSSAAWAAVQSRAA